MAQRSPSKFPFPLLYTILFLFFTSRLVLAESGNHALPLGVENGSRVQGSQGALDGLEAVAPGDIELILANSTTEKPGYAGDTNPFGHIALRIGDMVYTVNQEAIPGQDPMLILPVSLDDYLYGVTRPPAVRHALHGSNYGLAYARDNLGLRVKEVSDEQILRMKREIAIINDVWAKGGLEFSWKNMNCTNITERILVAGDLLPTKDGKFVSLPLDLFQRQLDTVKGDSRYQSSLVAYNRVPGSKNQYRYSFFPLSIFKPLRSLRHLAGDQWDRVMKQVVGSMVVDPGTTRARLAPAGQPVPTKRWEPGIVPQDIPRLARLGAFCARYLWSLASRAATAQ